MPIVYEDLDLPAGGAPNAEVRITLVGAGGRPIAGRVQSTGKTIVGTTVLTYNNGGINSAGIWSADLVANTDILPPNTTYLIEREVGCDIPQIFVSVPASGGPFEASTIEDDPLNSIEPSVLSQHAADLALHGGGIEVQHSDLTTSMTITGAAFTIAQVTGVQIVVPDLNRPVYLHGRLFLATVSGAGAQDVQACIANATSVTGGQINALTVLDAVFFEGTDDDAIPTDVSLFARLPAHSAGAYVIGASRVTSPFNVRVLSSALSKSHLYGVTR
jgi:hypothetical protein